MTSELEKHRTLHYYLYNKKIWSISLSRYLSTCIYYIGEGYLWKTMPRSCFICHDPFRRQKLHNNLSSEALMWKMMNTKCKRILKKTLGLQTLRRLSCGVCLRAVRSQDSTLEECAHSMAAAGGKVPGVLASLARITAAMLCLFVCWSVTSDKGNKSKEKQMGRN